MVKAKDLRGIKAEYFDLSHYIYSS